jgi:hypothetical protein
VVKNEHKLILSNDHSYVLCSHCSSIWRIVVWKEEKK